MMSTKIVLPRSTYFTWFAKIIIFIILVSLASSSFAQPLPISTTIETKIDELLARMTLAEKIGQLAQVSGSTNEFQKLARAGKIGSFLNVIGAEATNELQKIAVNESRLGIPLIFGYDVIHGYRTIFPIPLGEAATWNPALVQQAASVAASEARASGIHWTFAPMVDIARDARWGRIAEGSGEDPFLGSVFARARVLGFQGQNLADPTSVVACVKHYVAYGAAEGGRDYNTTDLSLKTLYDIYLPPFQAAVNAGVGTLMSAFNDINGTPATANYFTLTEVLRNQWGFTGFVVSDWNSIGELVAHGVAADVTEATQKSLLAGVEMDMQGIQYREHLTGLVQSGQISTATLDQAVRRVLRIKFQLGLFEKPFVEPDREKAILLNPAHLKTAREVAQQAIVLLKNDRQILPLSKTITSIALIGPLAKADLDLLGCWFGRGEAEEVTTVFAGIQAKLPAATKLYYNAGCAINGTRGNNLDAAVKLACQAAVAILVVGESAEMSGEAASRSNLDLPGLQLDLIKAVHATGTPTVVVLMNGRPLSIPWMVDNIPAIVETWQLGTTAGQAIADVLFGDYNPGGKLPVTFPLTVGQVPIYYNYKNTGRPASAEKFTSRYIDIPSAPLFPFGFGLSYTQFAYRDLKVEPAVIFPGEKVSCRVLVQNTGSRSGDEVVQLYVQDVVGTYSRPVKELKGFQRITLAPGETREVEFTLESEQLGYFTDELKYVVEPGWFKVWLATNSASGTPVQFELRRR